MTRFIASLVDTVFPICTVLLTCTVLAACAPTPDPPPGEVRSDLRDVILITADTWRGDHALTTVAGVELTPRLADFAQDARVFSAAQSVGNCTSVGTAGILTGLLPHRSAVTANVHRLPPEATSITSLLSDAGYATAAFVANPVLRLKMGFEQGFDVYRRIDRRGPRWKTRGEQLNIEAMAWLDEQLPDQPIFLWVHYMEPHGPYEPLDTDVEPFELDAFGEPVELPLLGEGDQSGLGGVPYYQHGGLEDPSTDGRWYAVRYAAEVRSFDRVFGQLLDGIDRRGRLANAWVAVTSDHGEALLGEHGRYFCHAFGLTADQVDVPLMLRCPADLDDPDLRTRCEPGERSDPVSVTDLAPTLVAGLGLEPPATGFDGTSLFDPTPRPALSQHRERVALRRGPWKLIRSPDGTEQLFHLLDDPGERDDLSAAEPTTFGELRQELDALLALPPVAEPQDRLNIEHK